jgi:dGTPase
MPANPFYTAFDTATRGGRQPQPGEYRSAFQIDRDRIIHSSAFRRLQNKTQVFLSGEYDFYRTRLTHSIEVAQIGRSICAWLAEQSGPLEDGARIDADLVESACLSHDLGHPPFGHTGERTLHRLMQPYGGFEGNAQTLRLLTRTLFNNGRDGMDPTRALLDAVLKYKSLHRDSAGAKNHYLYDDQEEWLDFTLGGTAFPPELPPGAARNRFKSIECQIMDWADDTAYSVNDVADGIQAGFIDIPRLEKWASNQSLEPVESAQIEFLCNAMAKGRVEAHLNRQIGDCIRAARLVPSASFLSASTQRHGWALEVAPEMKAVSRLNKRIAYDLVFKTPQLQQFDFKVDFILTRLFEVLRDRYIEVEDGKYSLHLMPETHEDEIRKAPDAQARARLVCDWVASMTDAFAFRTYRRLFDANFGSITDFV